MLAIVGRSYALLLTKHHFERGDCEASDLQRSCALLLTQAHLRKETATRCYYICREALYCSLSIILSK